ncbi:hypothetical protein L1049_013244 [Liquidambar formosana]|uniref:Uncharacterized protein n=1 Tax=Liquidambar formosana TaxID=63359 RepID=A0AAP0WY41_LIQFO
MDILLIQSYSRVITEMVCWRNQTSLAVMVEIKLTSIPMEGGGIIGFHGCAGPFVNGIGVYAKPMSECQKIEKE